MRKQILKGIGAAALMAVTAALSVPAEAAMISANVPFSFEVNKKTLPPGRYSVSNTVGNGLVITGLRSGAVTLSIRLESRKVTSPKMVFHRYGDEYILREVWTGGGSGHKLPESRRERELAAKSGGKALASMERIEIPLL